MERGRKERKERKLERRREEGERLKNNNTSARPDLQPERLPLSAVRPPSASLTETEQDAHDRTA